MGLLDSFERGLERTVNGAFAKTFRSGVQPVEIASALKRELDTRAAVISRDRILAPHSLAIRLGREDSERMRSIGPSLIDELREELAAHGRAQGFSFAGPLELRFEEDDSLSAGMLQISTVAVDDNVDWAPVLDVGGTRYPITGSRTIIGRGSDADITIQDTGASRKHAEVLWDGSRAQVRDLGSTNGTSLNGQKVTHAQLPADAVIQIGRTRLVFRLTARSRADDPARPAGPNDGFWGPRS